MRFRRAPRSWTAAANISKPSASPRPSHNKKREPFMSATRRNFFSWTRNLLAAGAGAGVVPAAEAAVPGTDYYDKLGVTKIINAAGTYTALTASTMPPQVRAAVEAAAKSPVRLAELQQKSGEYIASRLKCEAAMVTAGASSALTLGTAACMTLGN